MATPPTTNCKTLGHNAANSLRTAFENIGQYLQDNGHINAEAQAFLLEIKEDINKYEKSYADLQQSLGQIGLKNQLHAKTPNDQKSLRKQLKEEQAEGKKAIEKSFNFIIEKYAAFIATIDNQNIASYLQVQSDSIKTNIEGARGAHRQLEHLFVSQQTFVKQQQAELNVYRSLHKGGNRVGLPQEGFHTVEIPYGDEAERLEQLDEKQRTRTNRLPYGEKTLRAHQNIKKVGSKAIWAVAPHLKLLYTPLKIYGSATLSVIFPFKINGLDKRTYTFQYNSQTKMYDVSGPAEKISITVNHPIGNEFIDDLIGQLALLFLIADTLFPVVSPLIGKYINALQEGDLKAFDIQALHESLKRGPLEKVDFSGKSSGRQIALVKQLYKLGWEGEVVLDPPRLTAEMLNKAKEQGREAWEKLASRQNSGKHLNLEKGEAPPSYAEAAASSSSFNKKAP